MAIRQKLKARFGISSKNASDATNAIVSTEGHYTGRKDIEYYKPHEIPKSKYGRGKVDKEHIEKLESYTFGDAFGAMRRTSLAPSGTFSPGGTQALSAAPSAAQSRRASWMSRNGSDFSTAATSDVTSSDKISENSEDDTDVMNGKLSLTLPESCLTKHFLLER